MAKKDKNKEEKTAEEVDVKAVKLDRSDKIIVKEKAPTKEVKEDKLIQRI